MAPDMFAGAESLLALASGATTPLIPGTRVWEHDASTAVRFVYQPKCKLEVAIWWCNATERPDVRLICGLYPNWIEVGSLVGNGFDRPRFQGQGFGTLAVNLVIEALQGVYPSTTCIDGAMINVDEDRLDAGHRAALTLRRRAFWQRFGFRLRPADEHGVEYIVARVGELRRLGGGCAGGTVPWTLSLADFAF